MQPHLSLKDHQQEKRLFKRRVWMIVFLTWLASGGLIARLVYLQVHQHQRYTTLSDQNHLDLVPIVPRRGLILDHHGTLLADNIPVFKLVLVPQKCHLQQSIHQIRQLIPVSDTEEHNFFKLLRLTHRRDRPIPLKLKLTQQQMAIISVHQHELPGVSIQAGLLRHYPLGAAGVNVLGYMGPLTAEELHALDHDDYQGSHRIGKLGIEKQYEQILHGHVGHQKVEVDAKGHTLRKLDRTRAQPGYDLMLTLDAYTQQAAQKAMQEYQGAVVAIDPQNGGILAFLSAPNYDPNAFVRGISTQDYRALNEAAFKPLFNRTIHGQFPLASTIKPFIAIAALQQGLITPKSRIFDKGWFQIPGSAHRYRDWKKGGHGWVNLHSALITSCDTFFYHLALKLGISPIADMLQQYGFGMLTGIDMPGELSGIVPTPQWKLQHKKRPWYGGDTVITGIGQGFLLATPLQMAQATAILANHGQGFKPHLLKATRQQGQPAVLEKPEALPPVPIADPIWREVVKAMQGVVSSSRPWGTGHRFGRPSYTVAAKTGTAQLFHSSRRDGDQQDIAYKLRDHSLFIAFAPVDKPRIAIAIVVEHSPLAPAIARKVMDAYLLHKEPTHAQH